MPRRRSRCPSPARRRQHRLRIVDRTGAWRATKRSRRWIAEYDEQARNKVPGRRAPTTSPKRRSAWADGDAEDNRVAFLESRKAAAAKGATAEFRKMEGVNGNPAALRARSPLHLHVHVRGHEGMADDQGDIQVAGNNCGVVYQMSSTRATRSTGWSGHRRRPLRRERRLQRRSTQLDREPRQHRGPR